MTYDETTYNYIHFVTDQVSGLTASLVSHLERVGQKLGSYQYLLFKEFFNSVREMQIKTSQNILAKYRDVQVNARKIADISKIGNEATDEMMQQLSCCEDIFKSTVIVTQNIPELISATSNPNIPGLNSGICNCFKGYRELSEKYDVPPPDTGDSISDLMWNFYNDVKEIYNGLFSEYDKLLNELVTELDSRLKRFRQISDQIARGREAKDLEEIKIKLVKRKANIAVAKAAIVLTGTIVSTVLGIKKKNEIVVKALGLVGAIRDRFEKNDEAKGTAPKKSLARSAINHIARYNDAFDAASKAINIGGNGDQSFIVKAVAAGIILSGRGSLDIDKLRESKALDAVSGYLSFIGKTARFTSTAVSGASPLTLIMKAPQLISSGIGLVEKVGKYFGKNNIHIRPAKLSAALHRYDSVRKTYEDAAAQEWIHKKHSGLPAASRLKVPRIIRIRNNIKQTEQFVSILDWAEKTGLIEKLIDWLPK